MVCAVVAGGRASELEGKRLGRRAVLLGDGGGGLAPGQTGIYSPRGGWAALQCTSSFDMISNFLGPVT